MYKALVVLGLVAGLVVSVPVSAQASHRTVAHQADAARADASVPGDRWMEIDLYWFDQGHLQKSVDEFWNRFAPMYAGVQGDRGLILNVGWTVGYIMEWSGDLQQRITLPKGTGQQPWVSETSSLAGTTEERKKAWKERFSKPIMVQKMGYGPWTYGDLKQLGEMLRATGKRRGIDQFKVGSLVYAWDNAYGEVAPWATRHPEAFTRMQKGAEHVYVGARRYFDPALTLHRDDARMGGLPHGITEGMPAHEAFAAQWGSLSRTTGLDAIMLRDSIGFLIPYVRRGPVGDVMPSPQAIKRVTESVEALVKETKQANPRALVMMYSNAASAISDWRSNGCDLEKIAKEGYLDVFVDQTWAGAWNEVGTRHANFWNTPTLGWTYQLDYTLMHGAMLADTKVKHYPLVETFDAWESWDVLHTVPQRLRWGIWAYSHAGVKTPHGLRMPEGSYISWANQGKRLLSDDDVQFLSENIGAAVRDAYQTADIYGPTLVYARSAMQWEAEHATPTSSIKEWIDELGASVGKWPVPILSATRVEWLPQIHTDLAIVQTPVHLTASEMAGVKARIASGKPTAIFGSFAGGVDASLLKMVGVESAKSTEDTASIHTATLGDVSGLHTLHLPQSFPTLTRLNQTEWNGKARAVYSIGSSPQLLLNAKRTLVLWDPADATIGKRGVSLRETWGGSAAPYAATAAALNALLMQAHVLHAESIDMDQTGAVGAWRSDGRLHMLFGNVEEGLRDDADRSRHFTMQLPAGWRAVWKPVWKENPGAQVSGGWMKVDLGADASLLMEGR
ncbi:MAG: hypothetical protein JSS87_09285 [Acidobacteria bacterium]|nr:hypothetical protein [Acidobacteriota bacterium]